MSPDGISHSFAENPKRQEMMMDIPYIHAALELGIPRAEALVRTVRKHLVKRFGVHGSFMQRSLVICESNPA